MHDDRRAPCMAGLEDLAACGLKRASRLTVRHNVDLNAIGHRHRLLGLSPELRKHALDGVFCAVSRDMRQAACGFNRQGSRAS